LEPIETLFDRGIGQPIELPPELSRIVGTMRLPDPGDRPLVIGNFVSSIDGVVSLASGLGPGGSEISGGNPHDRALMGLLRALADVVVVGAGTVRSTPQHAWTPTSVYPSLASEYQELRRSLGRSPLLQRAVVTASGNVDPTWTLFREPPLPTWVLTSTTGKGRVEQLGDVDRIRAVATTDEATVTARAIVGESARALAARVVLVEGGPHLLGQFIEEKLLDELFLTLAPQIAGRDDSVSRPGLVSGHVFAPAEPRWGTLVGVKQGGSFLFLRYSLPT
jgi:riboflavin biosynthesis pyrimidine reductase